MANDGVHDPVNTGRRRFLSATTAVVGAVGVGFTAVPFIKSWNPSARAKLAGAPVVADISALQEGQRLIVEWRGQPIWIVKRSKAILDALHGLDGRLKDPESGEKDQQPEYVLKQNPSCARSSRIFPCWSACARTWAARRKWWPRSGLSPTTRSGRAATSAPATSRASTCPAASSGRAGADQPEGARAPLPGRQHHHHRCRSAGAA